MTIHCLELRQHSKYEIRMVKHHKNDRYIKFVEAEYIGNWDADFEFRLAVDTYLTVNLEYDEVYFENETEKKAKELTSTNFYKLITIKDLEEV